MGYFKATSATKLFFVISKPSIYNALIFSPEEEI